MILGIDAHCIRGDGGSITHLREVLRVANPSDAGFSKVVLWSGGTTLAKIEDRPWLVKEHPPALDRGLVARSRWSTSEVASLATNAGCDVLWLPGCSYAGSFRPFVAMSRNMLPFEWDEMRRYGATPRILKFLLLRLSQSATYRRADGMIYLSEYAQRRVGAVVGKASGVSRVIPHGIEFRFAQRDASAPSAEVALAGQPLKLLYVSAVDVYKHQWRVIEAVEQLQRSGVSVELTLIGPTFPYAEKRFRTSLAGFQGVPGSVRYLGSVPHAELHRHYHDADIFVYASSCENLPNILLEAMAAGLPVACSSRGPMPEILRDAGVYFDPEQSSEIAAAIRQLVSSAALRADKGSLASKYAGSYSWQRCAAETLAFLADVGRHGAPSPLVRSE